MKSLLLLPVFALAAYASDYSAICPSKDGTTATLLHGYEYQYHCGRNGKLGALYATHGGIGTEEKCATACQESSRCKGSAWTPAFDTCRLFEDSEQGLLLAGSVFLSTVNRGSPPCEDIQDELDQCTTDLQTANDAKTQCSTDLDACQDRNNQCTTDLADCQTGQEECKNDQTLLSYYQSAVDACSWDGREIEVDGYGYDVICNKITNGPMPVLEHYTTDFQTCVKHCSEYGDECKGFVYYVREETQCTLLSNHDGKTVDTYYLVITVYRK